MVLCLEARGLVDQWIVWLLQPIGNGFLQKGSRKDIGVLSTNIVTWSTILMIFFFNQNRNMEFGFIMA